MTRILGIVGSPRKKGNTDLLVARILEGARKAGAETEVLYLADLEIRECDGCHACWKSGRCSKDDDLQEVYPKIMASDAFVFGTPVYWYGPTALMKGFIDRFVYFNCPETRPGTRGKKAVLAVPYEEESADTVAPLLDFFRRSLKHLEMELAGQVVVPGVTAKGEILRKEAALAEAFEAGRCLAR